LGVVRCLRRLLRLHLLQWHRQGASWRVVDNHQKMEEIATARQLPALHLRLRHQDVS